MPALLLTCHDCSEDFEIDLTELPAPDRDGRIHTPLLCAECGQNHELISRRQRSTSEVSA